ncbi:MAG: hypothetical protein QM698_13505 [Micropepsaceae bacterium]
MDSAIVGAIIGGAIGLIYAGFVMLKAKNAKGGKYLNQMTSRVLTVEAPLSPDAVMAAFAGGVKNRPATLEASDPTRHRLVFTDAATMTTFGFFYPIHIRASGNGSSIDVGIVSRGNQWGPLVTKAHNIFLDGVKATLGLPAKA